MPAVPAQQNIGRLAKGSVRIGKSGSGRALNLPVLKYLRWESNKKGGVEAWHAPNGSSKRSDKTYLGHLGKQKLEALQTSPDPDQAIEAWVAERRKLKGLDP